MKTYRVAIGLALLLVGLSGSALADGASAVHAVGERWAAAWSRQDLKTVMSLYAPDAVFMPQSGERWSGVAEIRTHFAPMLPKYKADLHLRSVRVESSGALAFDSGTYTETIVEVGKKKAAPMRFRGNYLFVLRRDAAGHWRLIEQTWTALGSAAL